MGALFIATATVKMGQTTKDKDGNTIKHTPPSCEVGPDGCSVIVGKLKITDDTMEPDGPVEVFGDWDAANYLAHVLEELKPNRKVNIPDFHGIVRDMVGKSFDKFCPFFDSCGDLLCHDCIVDQWIEEENDG